MNYVKRMFSWKGQAGRKEMLGVLLFLWVPPALVIWVWFCLSVVKFFLLGSDKFGGLVPAMAVAVPVALWVFYAGTVRRLRHIGLSPWWALAAALCGLHRWTAVLAALLLVCLPPFKNKDPRPAHPSYLLPNAVLFVLVAAVSFLTPVLLGASINKKISFFARLPGMQKMVEKEKAAQAASAPAQPLPTPSDAAPAVQQRPRTAPVPSAFPAPDGSSFAERVAWKEGASPCGQGCWDYTSADGMWNMRVKSGPHLVKSAQFLRTAKGMRVEDIYFNQDGQAYLMRRYLNGKHSEWFYRPDAQTLYYYQINPAALENLAELPQEPDATQARLALVIHADGSYTPFKDLPDRRQYYRSALFGTPWNGFAPSPKFLRPLYSLHALPPWLENAK